jgi:selenocysteine lyase/cysteine desulfurase/DNA-binding HxlR family transcriptional regulator
MSAITDGRTAAIQAIAGKWTVTVMGQLDSTEKSYSELQDDTSMDPKQLGRTLEKLRGAGLVERLVCGTTTRPRYRLTAVGQRILSCTGDLAEVWSAAARGHENALAVVSAPPVPLVTGGAVRYANLDHAASTSCLERVRQAVDELLPWYASVHRGAGLASQLCTKLYEDARFTVRSFADAPDEATVVFTRNTTDSLNLLGRSLPTGTTVFCFDSDHHAALLAWPKGRTRWLPVPDSIEKCVDVLDAALRDHPGGERLVVLTAASNVTGELWPIGELAAVARRHGARTVLDAAQIAPHRPLRMREWAVDWLAFSGHKMYAPFGAGVLIGRTDWLQDAQPYLAGGGATARVASTPGGLEVTWRDVPERHEAGSPNVIGVHALATACQTLGEYGFDELEQFERGLHERLRSGLAGIPAVRMLSLWRPSVPGVGVTSFVVDGVDPGLLGTVLSAEHGIGLRVGAFCAHLATRTLLRNTPEAMRNDQALRVSIGLGNVAEHVDRLVAALREVIRNGPQWTYERAGGEWWPVPDPRHIPVLGR